MKIPVQLPERPDRGAAKTGFIEDMKAWKAEDQLDYGRNP